jgi:hypothetical protein
MIQKSSLPENLRSVSMVLTPDIRHSAGVKRSRRADGGPEAIDGSARRLAQERLELGEGVFDRSRPPPRSSGVSSTPFVPGQVVRDDDVALAQFGREGAFDINGLVTAFRLFVSGLSSL